MPARIATSATPAVRIDTAPRAMDLLMRVLTDRGRAGLREQATALQLPLSTAYRFASQLQSAGLISRAGRGTFTIGFELQRLASSPPRACLLADIARPHVRALAQRLKLTVHLGLIEEDMVTYVVKEHGGGPTLFTRAGTQLEAYCSAIGKVLLAALPDEELERYLGGGPFIGLTSHTIVAPDALRRTLLQVRAEKFAVDAEEVVEHLRCVAVPIHDRRGAVVCALSVSRRLDSGRRVAEPRLIEAMRTCAARIAADL